MEIRTEKYLNMVSKIVFPFIILAGLEVQLIEICGHQAVKPVIFLVTAASVICNQIFTGKKEKFVLAEICFLIIYIVISYAYFKSGMASVFNNLMNSFENVRPYNYVTFATGNKNPVIAETVFFSWIALISGAAITRIINSGSRRIIYIVAIIWIISVVIFDKSISSFSLIVSGLELPKVRTCSARLKESGCS